MDNDSSVPAGPEKVTSTLWSWAHDADEGTIRQAKATATLPIIAGHMALMPDAHLGKGATIGSVIPTRSAIIPSAVGVDIGCGMIALETSLSATDLPTNLDPVLSAFEEAVPAGVGKARTQKRDATSRDASAWMAANTPHTELSTNQARTALTQLGTLGSGNHFVEVCLDEREVVWLVLHSGSRGVGNQLARIHIDSAKSVARALSLELPDPELAYLQENSPEFNAYIADLNWAQDYAAENRLLMVRAAFRVFADYVLKSTRVRVTELSRVNCHHNYAAKETHNGEDLWVTRKGAIRAGVGDLGVIPGSMGAATYIVEGLGSSDSFCSCSHGAGRLLSRSAARRELGTGTFKKAMEGVTWQHKKASDLLDEHPASYRDIDVVMNNQRDLVKVRHELHQVLNYKGL